MIQKNVLFLCTGNSCRSQMAEALVNHFKSEEWTAYSAGTRPTGYVHPLALRALQAIGIETEGLISKSADSLSHITFDRVYTVCDNAATDCPVWLGGGDVRHVPFDDPAHAQGSEEEIFALFERVRNEIQQQIVEQL